MVKVKIDFSKKYKLGEDFSKYDELEHEEKIALAEEELDKTLYAIDLLNKSEIIIKKSSDINVAVENLSIITENKKDVFYGMIHDKEDLVEAKEALLTGIFGTIVMFILKAIGLILALVGAFVMFLVYKIFKAFSSAGSGSGTGGSVGGSGIRISPSDSNMEAFKKAKEIEKNNEKLRHSAKRKKESSNKSKPGKDADDIIETEVIEDPETNIKAIKEEKIISIGYITPKAPWVIKTKSILENLKRESGTLPFPVEKIVVALKEDYVNLISLYEINKDFNEFMGIGPNEFQMHESKDFNFKDPNLVINYISGLNDKFKELKNEYDKIYKNKAVKNPIIKFYGKKDKKIIEFEDNHDEIIFKFYGVDDSKLVIYSMGYSKVSDIDTSVAKNIASGIVKKFKLFKPNEFHNEVDKFKNIILKHSEFLKFIGAWSNDKKIGNENEEKNYEISLDSTKLELMKKYDIGIINKHNDISEKIEKVFKDVKKYKDKIEKDKDKIEKLQDKIKDADIDDIVRNSELDKLLFDITLKFIKNTLQVYLYSLKSTITTTRTIVKSEDFKDILKFILSLESTGKITTKGDKK